VPNGPPYNRTTPGWASTAAATASASAGSRVGSLATRLRYPPRRWRYVDGVSLDDLTLVVRAQEGDVRAFEALARRHEAALYRTAVRVTGDPAEAEDAVQEALLDAWRHLDRFRGEARFSTWMYRLVTNRCLGALRRRRPAASADARRDAGRDSAAPDSPEGAALLDLELAALGRAVQDLPDDLRVCWVLRELEGLGYGDIAEITGAGETAVRGRIHRARVRLAGVMREWK
jgi:RNA polymerase sigma-70 factor, ECF subfamily